MFTFGLKISKAIRSVKKRRQVSTLGPLQQQIIRAILEKKGENVISMDLRKLNEAAADYFIICEADSVTQTRAIADFVEECTLKNLGDKPWHAEGTQNAEWILLDYVDTVVHIFHKPLRRFYQLEELWSDALIEEQNE
jgi:ribosome-associated protein